MRRSVVRRLVTRLPGWGVLLGALATAGAAPAQSGPALATAERMAAERSRRDGLQHAVAAAAADGIVLLYPGADLIRGRAAVSAWLAAHPALDSLVVQWTPQHIETSADGQFGVSWGVMTVLDRHRPEAGVQFGWYLAAWTRSGAEWRLAAFAPVAPLPPPRDTPAGAVSSDAQGAFADADRAFAARAAADGAPIAFMAFATRDAVTFSGSGLLNRGPAAIRAALEASPVATARWDWAPIVAETATSGDLGFTAGRATIRLPAEAGGAQVYSKYLSLWRLEDGLPRFLADGGSGRPSGLVQP